MICLEADTGKPKWQVDLVKKVGARPPKWGFAFSPLVEDGLVYTMPGGPDGQSLAAFDAKCSTENEQNRITLQAGAGPITFKQIAGVLARRIVFYPRAGDRLARGQRIGIILFGSRVDLFVPDGGELLVGPGEKVKAGRTGLARWK